MNLDHNHRYSTKPSKKPIEFMMSLQNMSSHECVILLNLLKMRQTNPKRHFVEHLMCHSLLVKPADDHKKSYPMLRYHKILKLLVTELY